jgi:hypothetical protein
MAAFTLLVERAVGGASYGSRLAATMICMAVGLLGLNIDPWVSVGAGHALFIACLSFVGGCIEVQFVGMCDCRSKT